MLHYIRFYNHHIFIFLTLILHKLFSLPIYILIYTSTPASLFQLGLWRISKYYCCATENSETQVCNCDDCDLVLELKECGNLTFMYSAIDAGASAVLSMRNNWVFLPLCDPELSYKNVPSAERLCSDLTSLRIAFSIQAIPSSVSGNYLDQPGMVQ